MQPHYLKFIVVFFPFQPTVEVTNPTLVNCPWSDWSCNCENGKKTRERILSQEDQDRGAKCENNDMEIGEDCDAGSCSCRVVSLQCFPPPDSNYPIYDNYAGEEDNQCRANTKDCEVQPDQRSDEKTWAECDDSLCFDHSGCKLQL